MCGSFGPRPAAARCPVYAVAHRTLVPSLHHCAACLRQPQPFPRVHAVGPYAGTLQDAVRNFKYHGKLALERSLGKLLAAARRSNLCGAFAVTRPLTGRRILLLDDMLTTAATARECTAVLRAAGAVSVEVALVGRA